MYKVQSSHFVKNKVGATLVSSLSQDGEQKNLIVTVINPKDSENIEQVIDASSALKRLSDEFDRAEALRFDVEVEINEENHELTAIVGSSIYKVQPTELNFY